MRIIQSPDLPAVVLVRGRGAPVVAVPAGLASHEVLELASLVLSPREYEELWHVMEPCADRAIKAELTSARGH